MRWNVIVTTLPGRPRFLAALEGLRRLGEFRPSAFRDVCLGRIEDVDGFLEAVQSAKERGEGWALAVARAIPIEQVFAFTPETLAAQLEAALAPLAARMGAASFHLRLERRGLAETLPSDRIEREVADHLYSLAEARGIALQTDFHDPDYVLVAETVGTECGVALLPRALRERFPFVAAR
jgi:tRNA(Ser,Leu) C12 N-acetylase TAN1